MKKIISCIAVTTLLVSCAKNDKKLLVYSRGKATINQEAKTITVEEGGTSQEEQTIDYNSAAPVDLKVKSQAGEATINIPENGYYIVNVKNDTIIGSYQVYGAPKSASKVFTQDDIKHTIDSLQQLIQGKNINAANRNFYILPNTAVKISNNLDAFVVGPFHQMTSIEKEEGKVPEVYRFYTINEVRELIAKQVALTK